MRDELRKVKRYAWGRKQANDWDRLTQFIYTVKTYDELKKKCINEFGNNQALIDYAFCRWYNFNTHNEIQEIFLSFPSVKAEKNKRHKSKDFYIDGDSFDLKLSVYPKSLIGKIKTDKEIAQWLYKNQSQGNRKHHKRRIFVLVLDDDNPKESWKVKSEFDLIENKIKEFMKQPFYEECNGVLCAVIRVIKGFDDME